MSTLSELEAAPAPRPPELARRLAPKLVRAFGTVVVGVLYFPTVGAGAALFSVVGTAVVLSALFDFGPGHPMNGAANAAVFAAALVGLALATWPFAWWVRRRRQPARRLFENGAFVDAWIQKSTRSELSGALMTLETLEFTSQGRSMSASLSYAGEPTHGVGASRLLLVLPGESLVAAFSPSGEPIAGRAAGAWRAEAGGRLHAAPIATPPQRVVHANVPFAFRAVLALAFLFGFYALALGLIAALVAIPYVLVVTMHRLYFKVCLASLAGAFAILRALFFVRTQAFQPPGPTIHEADQPELFALIREVAAAMNTRMPVDVYLVPDVNAFVAEVGGFLGFGTRRVMGIGLGLLAVDDVSNLKATLAHEFGHFTGGDTALGGVIYRTRASIGRVLASLGDRALAKPFEWYGHVYLHITHAVSRHQELEADRAGIRVAGRVAHVEGLQREVRASVAFGGFVHGELAPLCSGGVCPRPLYEGFVKFFAQVPDADLDAMIASRPVDPLDTHPALAARLAFAETVGDTGVPRDTRPAMALLRGPAAVETALEPYLFSELGVQGALRRIEWDDVATAFYAPKLAEEARVCAERLYPLLQAGPSYADVARSLISVVASQSTSQLDLATALEPRLSEVPPITRGELAPKVLGRALGVLAGAALVERGGVWKTAVGTPLLVEWQGETFSPLVAGNQVVASPSPETFGVLGACVGPASSAS